MPAGVSRSTTIIHWSDGGTSRGGRGAVKPAAAGGGARRTRLNGVFVGRGESQPTDNAVELVRGRLARIASRSGSADFEHVADLSLAAWGGLTARLGAFDLPLADIRED